MHVIISQLHLAFARFHNRIVDLVRADPSLVGSIPATPVGGWGAPATPESHVSFGQIVTLVRWHYQWIALTDLLRRLVGPDTHAHASLIADRTRDLPSGAGWDWQDAQFS